MRDKELRLALVCYGGISLAVYMHGVTKEVWHVARASRFFKEYEDKPHDTSGPYEELLHLIQRRCGIDLRVLPDIVAGASAGGINGIFLSQAIATGQTLEPLTDMWLDRADVEILLDPDAKPDSAWSKFWATPLAWAATRKKTGEDGEPVEEAARDEIRAKITNFVRSRWFEPPFGGAGFCGMLLDAFDAMAAQPAEERLLPPGQPLDLFVSVTDFQGFPVRLKLNTPEESMESEHRITLSFHDEGGGLGNSAELAFAGRSTASFPGAFPPFNVAELDGVLKARAHDWPSRPAFLARQLAGHNDPERAVLIDGSVLANAPFAPAISALRDRPARREVDRRFVYVDPKPGRKAVRFNKAGGAALPGFFGTIFGAMSDIPREQPIRESLEAIEGRSARIRRMQRIIDAVRPEVEDTIERLFGRTFFLDRPNAARLAAWRRKAQAGATRDAGFAYAAYAHLKLSGIVEEIAGLAARMDPSLIGGRYEAFRQSLWAELRARRADRVWSADRKDAEDGAIDFLRAHDNGFRIRRLRFVIRALAGLVDQGRVLEGDVQALRDSLFRILNTYLERESPAFHTGLRTDSAPAFLDALAERRNLSGIDAETDQALALAFASCPKVERQTMLLAYLGFPYYDISTLPLLQGEGLDEFDPIKVDRISPEDALSIRKGGVDATLKGVEFNSFGAFFSRIYRENDYLWGRLHGADRLFDIICSSTTLPPVNDDAELRALKRKLLTAILDEEEPRLTKVGALIAQIRREIAAGPLSA